MKIRFWGTRGSIAAPGPETVRYGGNTTCIEVTAGDGSAIILDAGTGIRPLGLKLAAQMPIDVSLFISHTHWDHIHGLPFFVPLFVPGNNITIYGPPDPIAMQGIENVLSAQLAYPHFPVRVAELKSNIRYETLRDGQEVELGPMRISTLLMNHPALTFGFKVECDGKTIFFTGDHEPFYNIYKPGEPDYESYGESVTQRNDEIASFITGVDILIADSQYTDEEYEKRVGWGHSTFRQSIELAQRTNAKRLFFTHHETTRNDDDLDRIKANLDERYGDLPVELNMATEGIDYEV